MKNHRVVVSAHGGPEVLQVIEEELPEPGAGEVRIRVQAAGVSAYDLMHRRSGRLPGTPKVPFTLGEDVVGLVDAVGPGVDSLAPGQTVAATTWSRGFGGYTEHICLPATDLVPVPEGVDPAEAVCVVINYLTAHVALHRVARVRAGQQVLIHGAAGGVGSALVQLGSVAGLELFGTASGKNLDRLAGQGVTAIDYRSEDFVQRVRAVTGDGVDAVFDPIGGAGHIRHSYRALRRGGCLVWFGVAAVTRSGFRVIPASVAMNALLAVLPDGRRAPFFPTLDKLAKSDNAWYRGTLDELLQLLAAGKIEPLVAARVPLREAARAHELLEAGGHAGKVVLVTAT